MSGYQKEYPVNCSHPLCHVFVRYDVSKGNVDRFAVQLRFNETRNREGWKTIAQFDHDPHTPNGHSVFREGLHIDLYFRSGHTTKIWPRHPPLRQFDDGAIIRKCTDYFGERARWFVNVYNGDISPNNPPAWG